MSKQERTSLRPISTPPPAVGPLLAFAAVLVACLAPSATSAARELLPLVVVFPVETDRVRLKAFGSSNRA